MKLYLLLPYVFLAGLLSSCASLPNDPSAASGMSSSTYQPLAPTQQEKQMEQMQQSVYQ